jgi:hypothetical protein
LRIDFNGSLLVAEAPYYRLSPARDLFGGFLRYPINVLRKYVGIPQHLKKEIGTWIEAGV